jgi:hypothetical protein
MRNAAVYAGLLATTFASLGQAMVNLTILSSVDDIRFDDGILVEWATDKTYVRPNPASPLSIAKAVTDIHNTEPRIQLCQERNLGLVSCQKLLRRACCGGWRG